MRLATKSINFNDDNSNCNLYSAGIRHVLVFMALLHIEHH